MEYYRIKREPVLTQTIIIDWTCRLNLPAKVVLKDPLPGQPIRNASSSFLANHCDLTTKQL